MIILKNGLFVASIIGALWASIIHLIVSAGLSFSTGLKFNPEWLIACILGAIIGVTIIWAKPKFGKRYLFMFVMVFSILLLLAFTFFKPFGIELSQKPITQTIGLIIFAYILSYPLAVILKNCHTKGLDRHEFEASIVGFLSGFGYVFFSILVFIPFYIMVMTSLKSQQLLMLNPLDFSLDLSRGWDLFRAYIQLFRDYNFATYLLNSFVVSVVTVIITLIFSAPGAYAIARFNFKGRAHLTRGILMIYMVPMIVLALPIYISFSMLGLRNSLFGIFLIYPVTTIPVAIYMLQGYFRSIPVSIEEAGLMDGLSRFAVIVKIALPLSLPALASVSLYVFMIAWNEFLLAFMLLDDPAIFTLTRAVVTLNSSEIPRENLMAGAVISTLPIMLIFLFLEKFMTKGLTAGSVKG